MDDQRDKKSKSDRIVPETPQTTGKKDGADKKDGKKTVPPQKVDPQKYAKA